MMPDESTTSAWIESATEFASPPRPKGTFKASPDDFRVLEIPLYEPSGSGSHLWVRVRKRDVSHPLLVRSLAETLGVPIGTVKAAGRKDRSAVTEQWISIAAGDATRIRRPNHDLPNGASIDILEVTHHENGLKIGQLSGNRFQVVIRDVSDALDTGRDSRVLNWYGTQRFTGNTAEIAAGLAMLAGARRPRDRDRFAVNAAQAMLFNVVLRTRHERGLTGRVLDGDVLGFPGRGSVFVSTDGRADQERLDRDEVVLTGPIIGSKMRQPSADAFELERSIFAACGIDRLDHLSRKRFPGGRRPLTVRPEWHRCDRDGDRLVLEFTLPAGSYATVVLAEMGFVPSA